MSLKEQVFDEDRFLPFFYPESLVEERRLGFTVEETAKQVVITAKAKELQMASCAVVASDTLKEPLGDRDLIAAYDDESILQLIISYIAPKNPSFG